VKQGTENYNSFRGKIKSRHIDFAICKKEDLNVKTIIELDDKSHKNKTQKEKDRFKDNALKSAGISTIRIQAKNSYNVEELIKFIKSGFN
jgi:very-short-patch-repair endonuclease